MPQESGRKITLEARAVKFFDLHGAPNVDELITFARYEREVARTEDYAHIEEITARLAEAEEKADKWRLALEGLTILGGEFHNDVDRCVRYVEERYVEGHEAMKDRVKLTRKLREAEEKNKRLTEALEQTEELVKLIDVDEDGIYNIARDGKLIGYGGTAWDAVMSAMGFAALAAARAASTEESK